MGVKIRIQQLLDHHVERCGMIAKAAREKPLTASDMVPLIFHRPLDAHQAGFATGEVIAHINYMLSRGELRQRDAERRRYAFQGRVNAGFFHLDNQTRTNLKRPK